MASNFPQGKINHRSTNAVASDALVGWLISWFGEDLTVTSTFFGAMSITFAPLLTATNGYIYISYTCCSFTEEELLPRIQTKPLQAMGY